jgi:hypothetical protein
MKSKNKTIFDDKKSYPQDLKRFRGKDKESWKKDEIGKINLK